MRKIDTGRFGTLIVDCPWAYNNFRGAEHGAASSAMVTQSNDFLMGLAPTVESLLEPKGLVLFWATLPRLDTAIDVLRAWGLEYVTAIPWVKLTAAGELDTGIGHWAQQACELLMIARRKGFTRAGKPPSPVMGLLTGDEDRIFYCRKDRRHSQKPVEIHEYAETVGRGPFCEIFARRERPGWSCFGNELGHWIGADGIFAIKSVGAGFSDF